MRIFGWFVAAFVIFVGLSIAGNILGWFGGAVQVVQEQTEPHELQRKYELFKDEAAQLDKKRADIKVYESRFKRLHCHDITMDRVSREQCMVWEQEVSGITASYNDLAAEYNSQMAKWNYAFCNVGSLPKGASEPLPREFKPYMED